MSQDKDERRQFLTVGVQSYSQGMAAMARFRREICAGTRRAMERALTPLLAAMRLERGTAQIAPYQYPDGLKEEVAWQSSPPALGVKLDLPPTVTIFAALYWKYEQDRDAPSSFAYVSVRPWKAAVSNQLHDALQKEAPGAMICEDRDIWLEAPLPSEDAADFEQKLDQKFARWVDLFEAIRGFPQPS